MKAERKTLRLKNNWSVKEIIELHAALEEHGNDWRAVAAEVKTRSWRQVRIQVKSMILKAEEDSTVQGAETLLSLSVGSPSWSKEEKETFNEAVLLHGKDWIKVAAQIGTRN